MNENIVNVSAGMVQDGIAAPTYWISIFTEHRLILLKASKHTIVELASPLANRISSSYEVEEIVNSLKTMSVDQILNTPYEKVSFNANELVNLIVKERPASFFRSVIVFPFGNKTVKLSMDRDTIRSLKLSLHTLNPNIFPDSLPLHSPHYKQNVSYGIRAVGLIIFFWSLSGMLNGVGLKEIFLALSGLLIFFRRKVGAYVLIFAIVTDFLLMKFTASRIDPETLIKNMLVLIVLAGVLGFLWKSRNELK